MTTKTDAEAVQRLLDTFRPATQSIITDDEAQLVSDMLELPQRTDIELQNIRNMVILLYGKKADAAEHDNDPKSINSVIAIMDAMSAVCCAIDTEKLKRGMEV